MKGEGKQGRAKVDNTTIPIKIEGRLSLDKRVVKIEGQKGEFTIKDYTDKIALAISEQIALGAKGKFRGAEVVIELPSPNFVAKSLGELVSHVDSGRPNELSDLLGPFWTGVRVREALGIHTRQALDSRRRNGSVLGLKSADGDLFYPVSQFRRRPDGQVEVKPALVPFLRVLRTFDSWAVGVLLHTPAPELGGLTPLDWVQREGATETLENLSVAVAREWSAA